MCGQQRDVGRLNIECELTQGLRHTRLDHDENIQGTGAGKRTGGTFHDERLGAGCCEQPDTGKTNA
jgi:hypothetical protein